ncbi:hypothetical protein [Leucothrix pacifica]|uniref:Right handed beta helix domain-containing protein n=1 Tax=Leucothrix pacifica TaxID=1247513 RepID=A0A317CL57_9GAMM|nr:hypothetical protein [Leucothrix pacifica]PWQ99079.1 hypothetical protein DKW60_06465 [Leucothrix pacifica]
MSKQYNFHGTGENLVINGQLIDSNHKSTVYLSGHFRFLSFYDLGSEESPIEVLPAPDQELVINRLTVNDCRHLKISGMDRTEITGLSSDVGFHPELPMVMLNGEHCLVEGLRVFTTENTDSWEERTWLEEARNGIILDGEYCYARFNKVFNVRTGIEVRAKHGSAIANRVSNFFNDGMRALADNVKLANNYIMFSKSCGSDKVHSDAIQMWNHEAPSPDEGVLSGVSVLYNYIWNRSDLPGARMMQGIGCFNGLMKDGQVVGNIVATDHYHGITLGMAKNSVIEENLVFSPRPDVRKSWIKIGTNKLKRFSSEGNRIAFNESARFIYEPEMVKHVIANNTTSTQHLAEFQDARWAEKAVA